MKQGRFLLVLLAICGFFGASNAQDFAPGRAVVDVKHEYLPIDPMPNGQGVMVVDLPSVDSLNCLYRVHSFEKIYKGRWEPARGYYLLGFADTLDVNEVASAYFNDFHLRVASPDFKAQFHVTPVDSFFPRQWGLRKIKCPDAWRYTNGSPSVIIQIIDDCIDFGHPDLIHNIWQNSGPLGYGEDADGDGHTIEWNAAANKWLLDSADIDGVDGDTNDFRDDLVGWDFQYGDNNPECVPRGATASGDHGDQTAGTAAAVTNNYITPEEASWVCWYRRGTVAGTAWFSRIMPARFSGHWSQLIPAMAYGVDNGAKIISISWSYEIDPPGLEDMVDDAWDAGLLIVASAGNDASDTILYPAYYGNVIAVAGTESTDVKAANSNYGSWVDICAPYRSAAPSRDRSPYFEYYCYNENFSGTSASAPYVAGVAAMVWSCNLSATNAEVRDAILGTTDYIYDIPGNGPYYGMLGSGRVNALRAVREFRPIPPPPGDANTDWTINVGDVVYLVGYIYKGGPPPDPLCVGDVNDDGIIDVADVVYLVNYLYGGGPAPQDGCD